MEPSEDAAPESGGRGRQRDETQSVIPLSAMCRAHEPELKAGDEADDAGTSEDRTDSQSKNGRQGKKRHRRRPSKKKRRWKPYFKLTWEEKKELDERESARASRVRAEMFAKGLPVAPYNTTQFLMEEHDREEPDLNPEPGGRRTFGPSRSEDTGSEEDCFEPEEEEEEEGEGGGSDGMGRPGSAGGEFLQRDFSETYERYHVETLQNMSKQDLVREYLELEKSLSRLEEENNWLRRGRRHAAASSSTAAATTADPGDENPQRVHELERELGRVKEQNAELLSRCRQDQHPLNGCSPPPDPPLTPH